MATIRSVVVALLGAWVAACSLPVGLGEGDHASYFPMEANRLWEYRLLEVEHDRVWPVAVRSRGPRFVPELGRVVAIFDEEYPDQIVPVAFFLAEGFLHSNIGLGYAARDRMSVFPFGVQPMRLMPVPPRIGMRWTYSEEVFGAVGRLPAGFVIHWRGDIEAREAVEVPAGRFERCLRVVSIAVHRMAVREQPHEYRYTDWYAPNVGLVKSEYAAGPTSKPVTRRELLRGARSVGSPPPEGGPLPMAALAGPPAPGRSAWNGAAR
ncbi:MAG: TapB family protein [Candidatus Binatia bacterium]